MLKNKYLKKNRLKLIFFIFFLILIFEKNIRIIIEDTFEQNSITQKKRNLFKDTLSDYSTFMKDYYSLNKKFPNKNNFFEFLNTNKNFLALNYFNENNSNDKNYLSFIINSIYKNFSSQYSRPIYLFKCKFNLEESKKFDKELFISSLEFKKINKEQIIDIREVKSCINIVYYIDKNYDEDNNINYYVYATDNNNKIISDGNFELFIKPNSIHLDNKKEVKK